MMVVPKTLVGTAVTTVIVGTTVTTIIVGTTVPTMIGETKCSAWVRCLEMILEKKNPVW